MILKQTLLPRNKLIVLVNFFVQIHYQLVQAKDL